MIKYHNGEKEILGNNQNNSKNANLSADLLTYTDYDMVYYKGKKIYGEELEKLLATNCMEAYDQYISGHHKRNVAITLRAFSFAFLGVSIPFYLMDDDICYLIGSGFDIVGTSMLITSFPLGSVGKIR